jgi:YD repeat-containing protein
VVAAHGAGAEYEYDDADQLVGMIDAEGRTTGYDYDDMGRVSAVRLPGQNATPLTYQYDTLGNLRIAADQVGREMKYEYDSLQRVRKEIDQNGDATTYVYNSAGQLITLTDAEDNTTTWLYDDAGRLESETNELADSRTYLYDEFNRLVALTDRNLRVTTYDYDNLHRIEAEKWYTDQNHLNTSPGSPLHEISYDFDAASQLTSVSDAFADYDFDYDGLGRVMGVTQTLAGLTPTIQFDRQFDAADAVPNGSRAVPPARSTGVRNRRLRPARPARPSDPSGPAIEFF